MAADGKEIEIEEYLKPFIKENADEIVGEGKSNPTVPSSTAAIQEPSLYSDGLDRQHMCMLGQRYTAYMAAQDLIRWNRICRIDQLLYYYNQESGRFRRLTREAFVRLCGQQLGQIIAIKGNHFIKQIRECIFLDTVYPDKVYCAFFLSFRNIILDFRHGLSLAKSQPPAIVTAGLAASYIQDLNATCPAFDQFLRDVSGEDADLQERIWQALGYLLVPDQSAQIMFLLQGVPGSGKSVFCEFVRTCFEDEDVTTIDIHELSKSSSRKEIVGRLLLLNTELPDTAISEKTVKILKQLTGGDRIHAAHPDIKNTEIEFKNSAKILLATNHSVQLRKPDEALLSRIVTIPFAYVPERCDPYLGEKLAQERDVIVSKAIRRYFELVSCDFQFAGEYEMNDVITPSHQLVINVADFLETECMVNPEVWTSTDELYQRFCRIYSSVCAKSVFSAELLKECKRLWYPVKKKRCRIKEQTNPIYGFQGIELREFVDSQVFNI